MKSSRKPTTSDLCADKLRVLADVTRLAVMEALLDGPKTVTEINARLKIDQSLLSHHLKVLREAELVTNRREGKAVRYAVAPDAAATVAGKGLNLGCCEINFVQFKPKK